MDDCQKAVRKYLENRIKTKDQRSKRDKDIRGNESYKNDIEIYQNQRPDHVTLYMEGEKQRYPSLEIMKTYLAFS